MPKQNVFYILPHIDRIGELANQMFVLRNLFPEQDNNLVIITFSPQAKPKTNLALFQVATRGLEVRTTVDEGLLWSCYNDQNANDIIKSEQGDIMVLLSCGQLRHRYYQEFTLRTPLYHFSLSDAEVEAGAALRHSFGIPLQAKVITFHVRDGACFGAGGNDSYRNAHIINYLPAISHLMDSGFHVVRLGDSTMAPLPITHPQLHDAPHHPAYSPLVEPYFIASSSFFLGTPSGPLDIAHGFNVPALVTDAPIQSAIWGYDRDLFVFKKYYSEHLGRALSYGEVLMSPSLHYFRDRLFSESGISLVNNTAKEILAATVEMQQRLAGEYPYLPEAERANRLRRNLENQCDILRQHTVSEDSIPYTPMYPFSRCHAQISCEYARLNPWFFGHRWPEVRSWGWEPELVAL
ncbi:TIGR04372 family glycosyltransferase [Citrifermentans bremense]|uniref:TIGR04372 family glycosyltransferase n=1 Tax=Citrifermentans bremense TaxID=60035 RepID=UPI0004035A61|nr:TIGR04372 family glycosyltransferase [Citrifermentans bremense]